MGGGGGGEQAKKGGGCCRAGLFFSTWELLISVCLRRISPLPLFAHHVFVSSSVCLAGGACDRTHWAILPSKPWASKRGKGGHT